MDKISKNGLKPFYLSPVRHIADSGRNGLSLLGGGCSSGTSGGALHGARYPDAQLGFGFFFPFFDTLELFFLGLPAWMSVFASSL